MTMKQPDLPEMYNDYPLIDCATQAQQYIKKGYTVHQKWTCKHCHSRQGMEKANVFYQSGKCEACGEITVISACNYLVITKLPDRK